MARPWERPFIAAARLCAWCVLVTPLGVTAVLIAAAAAGRQSPDIVFFLGSIVVQLVATVLVGVLGACIGASVGAGCAFLTRELVATLPRGPFVLAIWVLSAFPAVVLGWFGALLVLPALPARPAFAVFVAATVVVGVAVIPRAFVITGRALERLPQGMRDAAAAAGASPARIAAHVTLPAIRHRLVGVYLDAFSRAVSEAAAVTVVFLAAARAGYPVAVFTLPGWILAHARSATLVDAGMAQAALLILVLATTSKTVAARRIGELQWA